jgi:predicted transcriptional regulator
MSKMPEKDGKREMLRLLKEERAETIEKVKEKVRAQTKVVSLIKKAMGEKELTVPELSLATGLHSQEVFWYLSTLKAYGEIEESGKEGNYYKYRLKPREDKS